MDNPLARLHQLIVDSYDLEDLRTLCFSLSVTYDALPGEGTAAKAREGVGTSKWTKRKYRVRLWPFVGKVIDWQANYTLGGACYGYNFSYNQGTRGV
jgi:hypothetical protein